MTISFTARQALLNTYNNNPNYFTKAYLKGALFKGVWEPSLIDEQWDKVTGVNCITPDYVLTEE